MTESEKQEELNNLKNKIIALKNEYKLIQSQLVKEEQNHLSNLTLDNSLEMLTQKILNLKKKVKSLEKPDYTNNIIDLYLSKKSCDGLEETYRVALHKSSFSIGTVRINLRPFVPYLGNIGYHIFPPYQGHKFALQSLELLKEHMIAKGLTKPQITIYPVNIASIKTATKFGGKLIREANEQENWNIYEVELDNNIPKQNR